MAQGVDIQSAIRFVEEKYGIEAATTVSHLGGGDWSRAFSFVSQGRERVIRFGSYQEDFLKDRNAVAFAQPDLPVPDVLEIGAAFDGYYAVSERRFGRFPEALDADGWRRLLPALLRSLDALREIEFEGGIDWFAGDEAPQMGWCEWLLSSLEDHPGGRVSGWRTTLATDAESEAIFRAGEDALRSNLWVCPEIRHLLHRDLLNRNVLVSNDATRIEAVFDWGCSLAGDFLYEVAWFTFWGPWYPALGSLDLREAVRTHYRALGLVVDHFDARLFCYELQIGLEHIAYATFTGRDDSRWEIARRTQSILHSPPR